MKLLKTIFYVIRKRPTYFYPYVRQTWKFFFTRGLYRLLRPQNIHLGKNVRIQEFSSLRVEVPGSHIHIGDNSIIWEKVKMEAVSGGKIEVGSYTEIDQSTITAKELVRIGNFVGISHNTYIQDYLGHPSDPEYRIQERKSRLDWFFPRFGKVKNKNRQPEKHSFDPGTRPVCIEDNVIIYRNVLILRGVTIGEGAVIAANTVVTKDVPPYTLFAGNPGKIKKVLKKKI